MHKKSFDFFKFFQLNFSPISAGLIFLCISFIYFNISMLCCSKRDKGQEKPISKNRSRNDNRYENDQSRTMQTKSKYYSLSDHITLADSKIQGEASRINKKYEFPATFPKAQLHLKANKFGFNRIEKSVHSSLDPIGKPEQIKKCACCRQPINTQQIPISYPTSPQEDQEFKLNTSTTLFFSFIKMAICYSVIMFICGGLFNLLTSLDGRFCIRNQSICSKTIFELLSTFNKAGDPKHRNDLQYHHYFCLLSVIVSIVFFILYKRSMSKMYEQIDKNHQTPDDYTIFVENIPIINFPSSFQKGHIDKIDKIKFDYEEQLKQMFKKEILQWKNANKKNGDFIYKDLQTLLEPPGKQKQYVVSSISLCFDLSEVRKINQQRQLLMQKHLKATQQQKNMSQSDYHSEPKYSGDFTNQILALNKIELQLCKSFASEKNCIFSSTHFIGKAFVSFQYDHYKQHIMKKYEANKHHFDFNGTELVLSRASHPTDIEWLNMDIQDGKRLKKVITSFLIVLMVLAFSGLALIEIDYLKLKGYKEGKDISPENKILNYILTILGSVLTSVINNGIWQIIVALSGYEKHKTLTNRIASQIIKAIIAQFINTVLILYLIQVFNHRPYLSSAGIVVQASTYIVVSGFISIFMNAINIPLWVRYGKLWWKYGSFTQSKMKSTVDTYQVKLNEDYELPQFDITGRYIWYLLQIYTCMFYFYIIPVGVLATAVIFGIQYWIDKVKLLHFSSEYKELGYFLSKVIFKVFECSLLVFTIGNLIFSAVISGENRIDMINLVSLGIAFAYICIFVLAPTTYIEQKFFGIRQSLEQMSYSECLEKHKFAETYWTQNPATIFAKEKDINNDTKYIELGVREKYIEETDLEALKQKFQQAKEKLSDVKQQVKEKLSDVKQQVKEKFSYFKGKIGL